MDILDNLPGMKKELTKVIENVKKSQEKENEKKLRGAVFSFVKEHLIDPTHYHDNPNEGVEVANEFLKSNYFKSEKIQKQLRQYIDDEKIRRNDMCIRQELRDCVESYSGIYRNSTKVKHSLNCIISDNNRIGDCFNARVYPYYEDDSKVSPKSLLTYLDQETYLLSEYENVKRAYGYSYKYCLNAIRFYIIFRKSNSCMTKGEVFGPYGLSDDNYQSGGYFGEHNENDLIKITLNTGNGYKEINIDLKEI